MYIAGSFIKNAHSQISKFIIFSEVCLGTLPNLVSEYKQISVNFENFYRNHTTQRRTESVGDNTYQV